MRHIYEHLLQLLFPEFCAGCKTPNTPLCGMCRSQIDWPEPLEKNGIFAAGNYTDRVLRESIWMLKYRHGVSLAEPLSALIAERAWHHIPKTDWMIVPIPLSKKRRRERGYNQAELLARSLAEKVGAEVRTDVIEKHRHTPTQVSVEDKEKRRENIVGAFRVLNMPSKACIILVDDVSTTGATIQEARKVLRASGAEKVIGLVVARG